MSASMSVKPEGYDGWLEVELGYGLCGECSVFHWFGGVLPTTNSSNCLANDGMCSWDSAQWLCSMSDGSYEG
jgi:hypothetical protein